MLVSEKKNKKPLDINLHMQSVVLIFAGSFEGILVKMALYLTKNIQKTLNWKQQNLFYRIGQNRSLF